MIKTLYPKFQNWAEKGSVFIMSDTHFDDEDCIHMNPFWITPEEQIDILRRYIHKNDTFIHLGDVGEPSYMNQIRGHKVLIMGNHDETATKFSDYFDEIYTGPLFIAKKILLSHEPIYGLDFCYNIHGHVHNGTSDDTHLNLAADVVGYHPVNLGQLIKNGVLAKIPSIHGITIAKAVEKHIWT